MIQAKQFGMPPVVITGCDASKEVGREVKKIGCTKSLIVTDKNLAKTEALFSVKASLDSEKISYEVFDGVITEPTIDYLEQGVEIYKSTKCDCCIGLGGGSPIDAAKAIAVMISNGGSIRDYTGINKIPENRVPLVAIPTTAGTGSEVTRYTIITDTQTNVKMLIGSSHIIPDVALVDPLLTVTVPQSLTAATGIDALTHAIEAYVSVKAQHMTDIFAISAIKLLSGNLRKAWSNGNNIKAREETMLGSFQAGIAFSNSSVALVHGMSRPLGAYFHVPHGVANAALLGVVMDFSWVGNPERYADIAVAMSENMTGLSPIKAAQIAVDSVKRLIEDVKIPTLAQLGVNKKKLEEVVSQMAEDAINSGSPANNPRQASKEEIIELYECAASL